MADNLWTLYAAQVENGANDVFIDQVQSQQITPGLAERLLYGSSQIDPQMIYGGKLAPLISLSTTKLASVLAKVGLSGVSIAGAENYVDFWFAKRDQNGELASGSVHQKWTMAEGLIVPGAISIPEDGACGMEVNFLPTHDGTNVPLVVALNQALGGTPAVDEAFEAGPVQINGSEIPSFAGGGIDMGLAADRFTPAHKIYPTAAAIRRRGASIRVASRDMLSLSTFGILGTEVTSGVIYLRQAEDGGTFYADNESKHIKATFTGRVSIEQAAASDGDDAECAVVITPRKVGATPLITWAFDQAIT